jgi:hypothetical protein
MSTHTRVGLAIAATAVLGVAVACVLADPPPIDPLGPPTPPTILTDIVTPRPEQLLTSQPVSFTIPVAVDPNQAMEWRLFEDLDPVANTPYIMDETDDGGVTDFADAATTIRVVTINHPFTGLDLTTCHWFTFVVAFGFDTATYSKPANVAGCYSCGTSVSWRFEPIPDCNYDDAAPPTQMPEAGDGASE